MRHAVNMRYIQNVCTIKTRVHEFVDDFFIKSTGIKLWNFSGHFVSDIYNQILHISMNLGGEKNPPIRLFM